MSAFSAGGRLQLFLHNVGCLCLQRPFGIRTLLSLSFFNSTFCLFFALIIRLVLFNLQFLLLFSHFLLLFELFLLAHPVNPLLMLLLFQPRLFLFLFLQIILVIIHHKFKFLIRVDANSKARVVVILELVYQLVQVLVFTHFPCRLLLFYQTNRLLFRLFITIKAAFLLLRSVFLYFFLPFR